MTFSYSLAMLLRDLLSTLKKPSLLLLLLYVGLYAKDAHDFILDIVTSKHIVSKFLFLYA